MGAREELRRLGTGLGVWVWLPVLGFVLLFVVAGSTPGADCDGSPDDLSAGENLLLSVAVIAGLGALAAAMFRTAALVRGPGVEFWQSLAAAAALLLILVIGPVLAPGRGDDALLWGTAFAGFILTAAMLVALVVAWMMRRKPDQVGLLLPAYLICAAIFVYLPFALLANGLKSGALC